MTDIRPRIPSAHPWHHLYWALPLQLTAPAAFRRVWPGIRSRDKWSRQRMDDYTDKQLAVLLRRAAREVPFYRDRFRDSFAFTGRANLPLFPVIDRETLRDHREQLLPADSDREQLYLASTGGSSGIPVAFYRHLTRTNAEDQAWVERLRWWAGVTLKDRHVVMAGATEGPGGERSSFAFDRRNNQLAFNSDDICRANIAWMLRLARDYNPTYLRGYPSALSAFASLLLEEGETLPVRAVITSSETLYDAQRSRIEKAFGARVHDLYGHSERLVYAGQCEKGEGYHVFSDHGFLEILDDTGQPVCEEGQVGEVIATTLIHDYFPLIRYRTGDRAAYTARRCSCGRPFPLILKPDGRLQELLVTGDGRRISMTSVNRHDDLFAAVDQFQFHQREAGRATLNVVPAPGYDSAEEQRILAALIDHMGGHMEIDIRHVGSIEKTKIGKHRFLIQEIERL